MDPQLYCLRWNNHQSNLLSVFDHLLQLEAFCDVTLAVEGASLKCHKMVLAACSDYFQNLFMDNTCKHPIVFLKDITFLQIRALLDYMYKGEVSVQEEELPALLKIAEALKVKGLVESDDNLAAKKITTSSKTGKNGGGKVWPVSTNKLMKTETEGDDPGTLVIDEESNDMAVAPVEVDYDLSYANEDTPPAPGMVKTIGPNGKVEWKRYKQYTKDDILAAIEEVKAGMSALQASRKYGVPSRTLYDKVKKMGILTANMQKQLQQKTKSSDSTPQKQDSRDFSHLALLGMQLPQVGLPTLPPLQPVPPESQQTDSGAQAPPSFTSPFMLSMLEKIKANAATLGKPQPQLGETPLNLSAMLDNGHSKPNGSEGSSGNSVSSEGESVTIKEENIAEEPDSIRAQFFADLKRLKTPEVAEADQSSVTVKIKEDDSSVESLPPRKRRLDIHENEDLNGDTGDCKKIKDQDDLDKSIPLETTSC